MYFVKLGEINPPWNLSQIIDIHHDHQALLNFSKSTKSTKSTRSTRSTVCSAIAATWFSASLELVPAHVVEAMLGKVVFHPAVTGKRRSLVAVQLAVNCPVSRISVKDRRVFVALAERLDPSPARIAALFAVLIVAPVVEPTTPES